MPRGKKVIWEVRLHCFVVHWSQTAHSWNSVQHCTRDHRGGSASKQHHLLLRTSLQQNFTFWAILSATAVPDLKLWTVL